MKQKGFAPILILLIVLVLGGIVGGMVYFRGKTNQSSSVYRQPTSSQPQVSIVPTTSQSDQIVNWKTYSSQTFSFKYPMEYKLYENQIVSVDGEIVPQQGTIEIVSPLIKSLNTNFTFSITSDQNKISKSLSTLVDYISTCSSTSSANGKPYVLGGIQAMIFEDTTCGPVGGTYIYAVNGNLFYIIQVSSHAQYNDIHSYVNQILSTFRFTDQIKENSTSNWKTYENKQIGLSIQYPSNWTLNKSQDGEMMNGIDLQGTQGEVHLAWGTGFGGGCDEEHLAKIQIYGEMTQSCRTLDNDGKENWNQIYKELKNTSFGARAIAYKPADTNRKTILDILATLKFSK